MVGKSAKKIVLQTLKNLKRRSEAKSYQHIAFSANDKELARIRLYLFEI
jgi:hypothetical protein